MQDGGTSGTTHSNPTSGIVNKGQSIIVKSTNLLGVKHENPGDFNFDIHSKSSAYYINEDEMQEYEEKI